MNFAHYVHSHKSSFVNLLKEENLKLKEGFYSKVYSLKLANKIVSFRFKNTIGSSDYTIVFSTPKTSFVSKRSFLKNNQFYFYDKLLNQWLSFDMDLVYGHIKDIHTQSIDSKSYLKIDHALSDTEKQALALGKDITVNFGVYNSSHKRIKSVTKNISADFSHFLGTNTPYIKINTERKKKLNNSISNDNY